MPALMWFREDLRVLDNPALSAAARSGDGVVALWIATPEQWAAHDIGPNRLDFLRRNVACLADELKSRNITLIIRSVADFDAASDCVTDVAREAACTSIHFNRAYGFNEQTRDEATADACDALSIEVHAHTDRCVFEPGTIRTGAGDFYSVYTPFFKSWCRHLEDDRSAMTPLAAPTKQKYTPDVAGIATESLDSLNAMDWGAPPDTVVQFWPAGEAEAHRRLQTFLAERVDDYDDARDVPAVDGTSMLSPYLSAGVISLRTCLDAVVRANGDALTGNSKGAATWIRELAWREFYQHILVGFPRVSRHRAFKAETESIVWNQNDEHFHAWCEGRTGLPIVDAAMRQLVQTGWMHNRLRMIVAMFLSKNLFLDWRRGERFFMQHLIDGDIAANNGGWQWAASTGTDAAPYFRIFNPTSQSKKFDAKGAFIRKFVPVLAAIDAPAIHEPAAHGCDYPEPIVDLKSTRAQAIAAFKALRED